jgi:hypothetical protein
MVQTIIEFEDLTKYKISTFTSDVYKFLKEDYPQITYYFAGSIDTVESRILNEHKRLLKEADIVIQQFKTNAEKLETVDFWELLDFIEDLRGQLQRIVKISKYMRSSRVDYTSGKGFAYQYTLGDGQTLEGISRDILQDENSEDDWSKIALNNDLLESNWNIDEGKQVTVYREKTMESPVTTFVDNMIGERIYGIDIDRKITFENNDLKVLSYKDTVYQCVDVLSSLKKGDVPEFPYLGVNSSLYVGSTTAMLSYDSVVRDLTRNFSTDDLFINFNVSDISLQDDSFYLEYSVDTKYQLVVQDSTYV